jgi:Fe2+ transport system protein FeoA
MVKASCTPDSSALVNDAPGTVPLAEAPVGRRLAVVNVTGTGRVELEREGVRPGCTLVVVARTPLGGPVVVELGRARLALSADVARGVISAAVAEPGCR